MIDLYTSPTPNGFKVSIMLEETAQPYTVIPIDINKGDQFDSEYLKLNPNNKIPTIVDSDGPDGVPYTVFESGAILMYLAEKSGLLMPADLAGRYLVVQWLMFQMGSIGPMLGQAHHFRRYAPEPIAYAIDRYTNEAKRLYRVMDRRLGEAEYLAGEYSVADILHMLDACGRSPARPAPSGDRSVPDPWRHRRKGKRLDSFFRNFSHIADEVD